MYYHVRPAPGVSGDGPLAGTLRGELAALDPRLPLLSISTLEAFTKRSPFLWLFRAGARVFTAFGLAGLVLALVGIWGVNAYTVLRRAREIGIRMALGATPAGVVWLVVRDTTLVTAAGVLAERRSPWPSPPCSVHALRSDGGRSGGAGGGAGVARRVRVGGLVPARTEGGAGSGDRRTPP